MINISSLKKFLPFKSKLDKFYKKIDFIFLNKTAIRPHEVKDFEFWMYLGNLLISLNPKVILELGSGKSTILFSDYSFKKDGVFFESVEQNYFYVKKIKKALRNSFLPNNYIKHVPLVRGWYDINKISKKKYDFIFVDGPTAGVFAKNSRSNKIALDFLKKHIDSCKVIIFDDSQRLHEQCLIKDLDIDANSFNFIDINCYKNYPQTRMRIYFKKELENIVYRNANLASNIL